MFVLKTRLTLFTLILCSLMVVSLSAQNKTFGDFDLDKDDKIERQEFLATFMEAYTNDWNTKDDPGLDDEDFYTLTYRILDRNDDNMLMMEEWKFGHDYYYGGYVVDDFWVYDLNGDNQISYAEYTSALYDTDYYLIWDVDRDAYLSDYELAERVFDTWDVNDNGVLNKSEFYRFDIYYSDI
jgi:hypothetical protein